MGPSIDNQQSTISPAMADAQKFRLLNDAPLGGVVNMARDEALMTRVGTGDSPPTLRLYTWAEPTISLGYFQRFADYETLPPPAGELPVVRRLTGGGAILHDLELTYSLTLPTGHALLARGANRLYELFHEAVISALNALDLKTARCGVSDDSGAAKGPFFCFARRHGYDVLLDQNKIAGSAQRRTRRAVLQHGSIVLANRFSQQPTAVANGTFEQDLARVWVGVVKQFEKIAESPCIPGNWSQDELALADQLTEKYAGETWTRRL